MGAKKKNKNTHKQNNNNRRVEFNRNTLCRTNKNHLSSRFHLNYSLCSSFFFPPLPFVSSTYAVFAERPACVCVCVCERCPYSRQQFSIRCNARPAEGIGCERHRLDWSHATAELGSFYVVVSTTIATATSTSTLATKAKPL